MIVHSALCGVMVGVDGCVLHPDKRRPKTKAINIKNRNTLRENIGEPPPQNIYLYILNEGKILSQ